MFRMLFAATAAFLTLICFSHDGVGHDDPITVSDGETYTLVPHTDTGEHTHTYTVTTWSPLTPDGEPVPVAWNTRTVGYTDSSHSHERDGYTDTHSHTRSLGDHSHSDFPAITPENEGDGIPAGWVDSEHTHTSTHSRIPEGLRVTTTHSHPHDPNGYHTHPGENVADIRERTLAQTDYWHSHDGYVRHSHPGSSRDSHGSLDHSGLEESVLPLNLNPTNDDEEEVEYHLIGPHSHDGLVSHTHLLPKHISHDDVAHSHTPRVGDPDDPNLRTPVNNLGLNPLVNTRQPVNPETGLPVDNADTSVVVVTREDGTVETIVVPSATVADIAATVGESNEQGQPAEEEAHPTFPLKVISVEEKEDPRRLLVTIRNYGKQDYRLSYFSIELLQPNGETVAAADIHRGVGPGHLRGRSETVLALLPPKRFSEADSSEASSLLHFRYFNGKQGGYFDGDRIALKYKGRIVSEHPERVPGEQVFYSPLRITSVEEKKDPRRLLVTIRNYGKRPYRLGSYLNLELLQPDGKTVVTGGMLNGENGLLPGRTETMFALLPQKFFGEVDPGEVSSLVHFPYFSGRRGGYFDDDRIALKYEGEIVSEYPERSPDDQVSDSPLVITSVEEKESPRRLLVTIRNYGRQTLRLSHPYSLELLQPDGKTVVTASMRNGAGSGHLQGRAETVFALLPKKLFDKVKVGEASFMMSFPYYSGKQGRYFDDDRLALKHEGEIISEYPEAEQVSAAPRLQRRLITSWGSLKME